MKWFGPAALVVVLLIQCGPTDAIGKVYKKYITKTPCSEAIGSCVSIVNDAVFTDTEGLNAYCKRLQAGIYCSYDQASEHCSMWEQVIHSVSMPTVRRFQKALCSPNSSVAEDYMKHSACIHKVSDELEECAEDIIPKFVEKITDFVTQAFMMKGGWDKLKLDLEDFIEFCCCELADAFECVTDVLDERCSPVASKTYLKLLMSFASPGLEEKCAEFTKKCPGVVLLSDQMVKKKMSKN